MQSKTQNVQCSGLQLSIDPGSRQMGIAVFDKDFKFLCSKALKASREQPAGKRLFLIRKQFEKWWANEFKGEKIVTTVIELLPPSQPKASLPISPGAVVSQAFNYSTLGEDTHIPVQSWKAMCRETCRFGAQQANAFMDRVIVTDGGVLEKLVGFNIKILLKWDGGAHPEYDVNASAWFLADKQGNRLVSEPFELAEVPEGGNYNDRFAEMAVTAESMNMPFSTNPKVELSLHEKAKNDLSVLFPPVKPVKVDEVDEDEEELEEETEDEEVDTEEEPQPVAKPAPKKKPETVEKKFERKVKSGLPPLPKKQKDIAHNDDATDSDEDGSDEEDGDYSEFED